MKNSFILPQLQPLRPPVLAVRHRPRLPQGRRRARARVCGEKRHRRHQRRGRGRRRRRGGRGAEQLGGGAADNVELGEE